MGTEDFDVDGDFAGNTFTVPATGYYLVAAQIRTADSLGVAKNMQPAILVGNPVTGSGDIVSKGYYRNTGTIATLAAIPLSDILYLTAGHEVEFWVYHNHGSNLDFASITGSTYMSIYRIA